MKSKIKGKQKVLPTSKLWLSLQSERCLQREAYSRHRRSFPPREKLLQKHKSNSLAVHSKPTFLIAEDSRPQNKDLRLYGKNQFCIRYQKTGTDHTLTVSPAMIRGEPILSISALKVPLCRQRFLRACPLYLSHTAPIERKMEVEEEKEVPMISAHGSKLLIGVLCLCLIAVTALFGEMLVERKAKIRLLEKKYSEALTTLELNNCEAKK